MKSVVISIDDPSPSGIAGTIARLGWKKIETGETVSPGQLEANYIRRTDAEILAKVGS